MNQTDITIIKSNIQAQLAGAFIAPIVLSGAPGTGKTSYIKQLATDMTCTCINISAPTLTTEQLSGLPDYLSAPHMDQYSTVSATNSQSTQWSVPEIVHSANTLAEDPDSNGCIILIDDFHRIGMSTMPYMYELLLERKVGQYSLHPKVAVVATMNETTDAGFSGMDSPIRNRLAIHHLDFDSTSWYKQYGINFHMYVASFAKAFPHFIQEDESTDIEGFSTPRALHFLSETLKHLDEDFIVENANTLAKQYLSITASAEFSKHVTYTSAINFQSIVSSRIVKDMTTLSPLDVQLYSFIPHYIDTAADGKYLLDLIEANATESLFVGPLMANIYNSFLLSEADKPITDGIRFVIDKILQRPIDSTLYIKPVSAKLKALVIPSLSDLLTTAAEYQ